MFDEDEIDDVIEEEQSIVDFDEPDDFQGQTINADIPNDSSSIENRANFSHRNIKQNTSNQNKKNNNQNVNSGLPNKISDDKVTSKLQNIKNNIGNNIKDKSFNANSNEESSQNDSQKNSFLGNKDSDDNDKKSAVDQVAEQAISTGVSTVLQSFGVPKPIADKLAEKLSGPLLKWVKFIAILPFVLFIIIFVCINGNFKDTDQSDEMTDYLYGNGDISDLYEQFKDMGICETDDECANSDAAAFYIKLKERIQNYDDETKKIAANFIIELTSYERDLIDDNGKDKKSRYDTLDEIDYLADIILAGDSLTIDKLYDYKDDIINSGYFETYRQDLVPLNPDFSEIIDNCIENAKISSEKIIIRTKLLCGGDIDVENFLNMTKDEYIAAMGPIAQADYSNTGVLASVTLAQSILESGWGKSGLSQNAKNFFGMKASKTVYSTGGWDGVSVYTAATGEEENGEKITITANFRKYDTVADSVADHSALFVESKRYKDVTTELTYSGQIRAIKNAGYATDSEYVSKIEELIQKYNLDAWDVKTPLVCGQTWTIRTIRPIKGDPAFSLLGKTNVGQCVWYAQGRAIEIIQELVQNNKMSSENGNEAIRRLGSIYGNAEAWYNKAEGLFKRSNNIEDVKAGSIISWSGGSTMCNPACGHVAVVESVTEDEVTITDGWAQGGNSCPNDWSCVRFRKRTMALTDFYQWVKTEGTTLQNNPKSFNGYIYFLELET